MSLNESHLSIQNRNLRELGCILSEFSTQFPAEAHEELYQEFQRLWGTGLDAVAIAEGLERFLAPRYPQFEQLLQHPSQHEDHPYVKLVYFIGGMDSGELDAEEDGGSCIRAVTKTVTEQVGELAETAPYRRSMPTLVDDEESEGIPLRERSTLNPPPGTVEGTHSGERLSERPTLLPDEVENPPRK